MPVIYTPFVTVPALPLTLPVTSPVRGPLNAVADAVPVIVIPADVVVNLSVALCRNETYGLATLPYTLIGLKKLPVVLAT